MIALERDEKGGFLCDGMGVGKTIETLCLLAKRPQKRTLLLMPKALVGPWTENGTRAGFPCFAIERPTGKRARKRWALVTSSFTRTSALYIANYEAALSAPELIGGMEWDRIVLDESHRIRNPVGRLTQRILAIQAPLRWALTGTPIVNSMKDAVAQLTFVGVPLLTPDIYHWNAKYYGPFISRLVIRRTLEDLRGTPGFDAIPPVARIETHRLNFLSTEEADFYHGLQGLRDSLVYARISPVLMFEKLLRLRQTAVSPEVYMAALRRKDPTYEGRWTKPSTKMVALANLVKDEKADHKFLVFCSFHDEMELLAYYLDKACGTKAELYHGGLTGAERAGVLERASEPSCRVLLIQLQSGGVGLNLQSFDRCVFMCPWWTSALMDQAIARAVRMGQTKVVKVIHLVLAKVETEGLDIDRLMMEAAEAKRDLLSEFFEMALD